MIPEVTYDITVHGESIPLDGKASVSFISPFNEIVIKFTSNTQLKYWEARITPSTVGGRKYELDDYDIGAGKRLAVGTSIQPGIQQTKTITVSNDTFSEGDNTYRISLHAQSMEDNTWDVYYLFLAKNESEFIPKDDPALYVLSKENHP